MKESWNNAVITNVDLAMYVAPGTGRTVHTSRAFYGFVINDTKNDVTIRFSDGTMLRSGPGCMHYFPKGSGYRVENQSGGGCWAINFDLAEDPGEAPFAVSLRNYEAVRKLFLEATEAFESRSGFYLATIRRILYALILRIREEQGREYLPSRKAQLIQPAVDAMNSHFSDSSLTVSALAEECGLSPAYLRRLFVERFSLSPQAYLVRLRMEQACRLLRSGFFSVGEVGRMCGYNEPCHFSREFSRYMGVSPKDYKDRT